MKKSGEIFPGRDAHADFSGRKGPLPKIRFWKRGGGLNFQGLSFGWNSIKSIVSKSRTAALRAIRLRSLGQAPDFHCDDLSGSPGCRFPLQEEREGIPINPPLINCSFADFHDEGTLNRRHFLPDYFRQVPSPMGRRLGWGGGFIFIEWQINHVPLTPALSPKKGERGSANTFFMPSFTQKSAKLHLIKC